MTTQETARGPHEIPAPESTPDVPIGLSGAGPHTQEESTVRRHGHTGKGYHRRLNAPVSSTCSARQGTAVPRRQGPAGPCHPACLPQSPGSPDSWADTAGTTWASAKGPYVHLVGQLLPLCFQWTRLWEKGLLAPTCLGTVIRATASEASVS